MNDLPTADEQLIREIRRMVRANGFQLFGMLPVSESQTFSHLVEWIDEGMQGSMDWMAREDAMQKRAEPELILPGAQAVMTLAFAYTPDEIPEELLNDPARGIIARYALYDDYHDVVKKKLIAIGRGIGEILRERGMVSEDEIESRAFNWKAYVDTGPFLEREWAERAGLGYIGRNANLINVKLGSYLFLSEILFTAKLPTVQQKLQGGCARCTKCVGECPTGAIVGDKTIDARKCISYVTIENSGPIPEWIRPLMKNRIYGCDICQEVCPWNKKRAAVKRSDFLVREDLVAPKFDDILFFDELSFRERFRKSPIKRAKREGFMRNVAVGLGNWVRDDETGEAMRLLEMIRQNEESALVQDHVKWAMAQAREEIVIVE